MSSMSLKSLHSLTNIIFPCTISHPHNKFVIPKSLFCKLLYIFYWFQKCLSNFENLITDMRHHFPNTTVTESFHDRASKKSKLSEVRLLILISSASFMSLQWSVWKSKINSTSLPKQCCFIWHSVSVYCRKENKTLQIMHML